MLVPEKTIDSIVEQLEAQPAYFQSLLEKYGNSQEEIFVFYASDNFKLLTDEENDLLIFFTLVILEAIDQHQTLHTAVEIEKLEKEEEIAWDLFDKQKANFRDKLNPFFEQSEEEDLLAFVEDGLVIEEENPVTAVGREILFINLYALIKSIISN